MMIAVYWLLQVKDKPYYIYMYMICNALRHAALLVLPSTLQCDMRWSQKHKRPLLPEELLCAMGMPVLQRFAEMCGSTTAQLENLSHSAKVPGAVDSAGLPSRLSLLVFPWGFDVISFWCYFILSVVFLMFFFQVFVVCVALLWLDLCRFSWLAMVWTYHQLASCWWLRGAHSYMPCIVWDTKRFSGYDLLEAPNRRLAHWWIKPFFCLVWAVHWESSFSQELEADWLGHRLGHVETSHIGMPGPKHWCAMEILIKTWSTHVITCYYNCDLCCLLPQPGNI